MMRSRARPIQRVVRITSEPPADLTIGAALDPEQSLSSGTTTATVEWPDATGGTAPYTYAISVKDEAGSAVTPNSGSGKGPYVIPVAAGKSYQATIGVTDADGQVARRAAMVYVAAAPGTVGWVKTHDLDFAGITPVSQSSASGSGTLSGGDFDGLPYKWVRTAGSGGSVDITTDGAKCSGAATGSYGVDIDISSKVVANDADDIVIALFVRDITGINSTTKGIRLGISNTGVTSSGSKSHGMKAQYASGSNWTPNIVVNDTSSGGTYSSAAAVPTEGRLTVRLRGGFMVHSGWSPGDATEPDDADIEALFLHQISESAKATADYTTGLWVGLNAIYTGVEAELYRVCIYEKGVT